MLQGSKKKSVWATKEVIAPSLKHWHVHDSGIYQEWYDSLAFFLSTAMSRSGGQFTTLSETRSCSIDTEYIVSKFLRVDAGLLQAWVKGLCSTMIIAYNLSPGGLDRKRRTYVIVAIRRVSCTRRICSCTLQHTCHRKYTGKDSSNSLAAGSKKYLYFEWSNKPKTVSI